MTTIRYAVITALALKLSLCIATVAAAQPQPATPPQPAAIAEVMQQADPGMRRVLEKLLELGVRPIETLSLEEARAQPTPTDAVEAVLEEQGESLEVGGVDAQTFSYSSGGQELPVHVYTPATDAPAGGWPVVVFYHGGGGVLGDIDDYEHVAKALAKKTNVAVAAVEYRQVPEARGPTVYKDAFAGYRWVLENAREFGGDPGRVAVVGESAGANLAANVALMARDQGAPLPEHMVLVHPIAGTDFETPSYREHTNAFPLSRATVRWFLDKVTRGPQDLQDPRLDLVGRADLSGLPPATVITADIDPLRSDGKRLAERLREEGVPVTYRNFEGVTHGFFVMAPVVEDAVEAQDLAAKELRQALAE